MSSQSEDEPSERAPLVGDARRIRMSSSAASLQGTGVSPIIHEDDEAITIRRPVHYYSINSSSPSIHRRMDRNNQAAINRYKYYSRLAPHSGNTMIMPNHIVPSEYYLVIPIDQEIGTQSSIVTIFSIWNTMVGTSILSMPWALERAGFGCGIGLMVLFAALTLYTAYRVMKSPHFLPAGVAESVLEFSDVCTYYLGSFGKYSSIVFSLATLLGAAIVFWVLMSNFLYHSVQYIFESVTHGFQNTTGSLQCLSIDTNNTLSLPHSTPNSSHPILTQIWSETHTVPFFLVLVLFPLVNFKSPTFFTKFNSLGTVSVVFIIVFVIVKAVGWGINVDFNDIHSDAYIPQFQWSFPALTGTLSLAYFIHNCVLSIVRNQRNPENNGRDLTIAFVCVAFTYIFVAILFYISFPLPKHCIMDNLLNNFPSNDILSFVARIFLFFQMVTVFPLLMYIFRVQVLGTIFGSIYPGLRHVIVVNLFVIGVAIVFAVFFPKIGQIIRFVGALCGLAYIFTLPCLVYMLSLKERGQLTAFIIIIHTLIITIGLANFAGQFAIL